MALIFRKEDKEHDQATDLLFAGQASMRKTGIVFLVILLALLILGTVLAGAAAHMLPKKYRAGTVVLVESEEIPNRFLPTIASSGCSP